MSDHNSTKPYPAAAPEISKLLGFDKADSQASQHDSNYESHEKTGSHPANLPVHEDPASGHTEIEAHFEDVDPHKQSEINKLSPKIIIKTIAPYVAVFAVGLGLYYFFLSSTDLSKVTDLVKSEQEEVLTPKETALETLFSQNSDAYYKWVGQYYFEVNDQNIIDPKTDNSGNGLTNFHKYLFNLNPRAYDTLSLGMADSQAIASGINPSSGGTLTDKQKEVVEKYFDMEVIMNRLILSHSQNAVAGVSVSNNNTNISNSVSARGIGMTIGNSNSQTNNSQNNTVNSSYQNNFGSELNIDTTKPGTLEIPSLKLSAPIIFSTDAKNLEKDLQSGVVHYPGTALPGQVGTAYISGHSSNYAWAKGNYNRVFSKLGDLANNTSFSVTVTLKDGKTAKLHFVVTRRGEYLPTDQEQFRNAGVPTVALSTCWPINTTQKRLVVFGELTQVEK